MELHLDQKKYNQKHTINESKLLIFRIPFFISSAFWWRWRRENGRQPMNAHYVAQLLTGTYILWMRSQKRRSQRHTEFIRKLHDSIPRDSWLEKQVVSFLSSRTFTFTVSFLARWLVICYWLDNKIMIKTGIGLKICNPENLRTPNNTLITAHSRCENQFAPFMKDWLGVLSAATI